MGDNSTINLPGDKNSLTKLKRLLFSLSDEIDFIYTTQSKSENSEYYYKNSKDFSQIMERVAHYFLSDNIVDHPHKIYFDCETTTAVWLLHLINKNFCKNNSLSPYKIGYSKSFYIHLNKRPSSRHLNKAFHPLTRVNFATSLRRFKIYSKDVSKIEHMQYKKVLAILEQQGITVF